MATIKRIPRKAKKGRRYVKRYLPEPNYSMMGRVFMYGIAVLHAIHNNSLHTRNTRGCRQYINIMVRNGLMKRPEEKTTCRSPVIKRTTTNLSCENNRTN